VAKQTIVLPGVTLLTSLNHNNTAVALYDGTDMTAEGTHAFM